MGRIIPLPATIPKYGMSQQELLCNLRRIEILVVLAALLLPWLFGIYKQVME
jgi:hypothetical protein